MYITKDIKYVGVNDHQVDLFEGQYPVPNGMAYNSYVIIDEQVAVMDTVDINFGSEWLVNIEKVDVFELAKQYPEAFGRTFDPTQGPDITNWIIEE